MTDLSKIIVYGVEFQDALKGALAVAAQKDPYDVIQLRVAGDGLLVCARDPLNNLMVGITVGATMIDVVSDRDDVIEITRADARTILAKRVKREDGEDHPLVGLIVDKSKITCTDETGLSLGIRQVRVRRATHPGEQSALGNIEDMLTKSSEGLPGEIAEMTPVQWKKLGAVAEATGTTLTAHPLEPSEDHQSRTLITGDGVAGFAAVTKQAEDEPMTDDELATMRDLAQQIRDSGATISVVTAKPPGGAA